MGNTYLTASGKPVSDIRVVHVEAVVAEVEIGNGIAASVDLDHVFMVVIDFLGKGPSLRQEQCNATW